MQFKQMEQANGKHKVHISQRRFTRRDLSDRRQCNAMTYNFNNIRKMIKVLVLHEAENDKMTMECLNALWGSTYTYNTQNFTWCWCKYDSPLYLLLACTF